MAEFVGNDYLKGVIAEKSTAFQEINENRRGDICNNKNCVVLLVCLCAAVCMCVECIGNGIQLTHVSVGARTQLNCRHLVLEALDWGEIREGLQCQPSVTMLLIFSCTTTADASRLNC